MPCQKRVREPPMRYRPTSPKKLGRGEFSDVENAQLLSALIQYGPSDPSKITPLIPTRNEYQVKQRISVLQKKAQLSLTTIKKEFKNGIVKYEPRDKVAIDKWLDQLSHLQDKANIERGMQDEMHVRMLARTMGLISKYEDHPKLEECGGVDLKNVYEFLENMMQGLPSKTLKNADSRFLIEALQRLSFNLDSMDVDKETSFLMCGRPQWRSKGQRPRTYGRTKTETSHEDFLKLLNTDKINPFQVPYEWLKRPFPQV